MSDLFVMKFNYESAQKRKYSALKDNLRATAKLAEMSCPGVSAVSQVKSPRQQEKRETCRNGVVNRLTMLRFQFRPLLNHINQDTLNYT